MAERRRRYRLGHHAELLCAWHLRLRGWRILARRYRSPVGEIDIVARRGRLIAFVEVKARRDLMAALESVSERQRLRVRRAAELFVGAHPSLAALDFRFDVMVVSPWSFPHHVIDAWRD